MGYGGFMSDFDRAIVEGLAELEDELAWDVDRQREAVPEAYTQGLAMWDDLNDSST